MRPTFVLSGSVVSWISAGARMKTSVVQEGERIRETRILRGNEIDALRTHRGGADVHADDSDPAEQAHDELDGASDGRLRVHARHDEPVHVDVLDDEQPKRPERERLPVSFHVT